MINPNDFNFDAIYAGLQSARASRLTLVLARDGSWAAEPADTWIAGQFERISANYSRAGLEAFLRDEIAALNAITFTEIHPTHEVKLTYMSDTTYYCGKCEKLMDARIDSDELTAPCVALEAEVK